MTAELTIGSFVVSSNGREIGRVKKVVESAFLVDAPLALDYWLERTLVREANEERVTLAIEHESVGQYKMDRPNDLDGFHEARPDFQRSVARDSTLL